MIIELNIIYFVVFISGYVAYISPAFERPIATLEEEHQVKRLRVNLIIVVRYERVMSLFPSSHLNWTFSCKFFFSWSCIFSWLNNYLLFLFIFFIFFLVFIVANFLFF